MLLFVAVFSLTFYTAFATWAYRWTTERHER